MDGVVNAILIKHGVIGVDGLVLVVIDSGNDTFVVTAHVYAWSIGEHFRKVGDILLEEAEDGEHAVGFG